jgi:hypothetical protein
VGERRARCLESFGGLRDTAERCLLPTADAEVPVHQFDALVCLGLDVMREAPWGDRRVPREIRA